VRIAVVIAATPSVVSGPGAAHVGKVRINGAEPGDQHAGGRLPRIRRPLASYDATSAWDAITEVRNANAPEVLITRMMVRTRLINSILNPFEGSCVVC
jgi:hypothetical protein